MGVGTNDHKLGERRENPKQNVTGCYGHAAIGIEGRAVRTQRHRALAALAALALEWVMHGAVIGVAPYVALTVNR